MQEENKNDLTEEINSTQESTIEPNGVPEATGVPELTSAPKTEEVPETTEATGQTDDNDAFKTFAQTPIEPPKKKKYGWVGTVLLLVAIGLGIWAMFGITKEVADAETTPIWTLVRQSSWVFALVCLAVLLAIMVADWTKYMMVMKATTGKFNPRIALKVQLLGKFYDNVTPFAVGGQPMQIYYLHKKGYSGGVSSAIILIQYFCRMTSMCFLALIIMACNTHVLGAIETEWVRILIHVAAWVGIAANMSMPLMVLSFVIFPKFSHKIATFVINIGYKLKIVKDKEKTMRKALKTVNEFRAAFKIMAKKPVEFVSLVFLCFLEECLRFSFPFFIMKMFGGLGAEAGFSTMITVMALNMFVTQSVTIIPTPGNSGAIESVGTIAFTAVITNLSVLGWCVLVWRFFLYYIYIIVGIGITVFEFIRNIVRSRRKKKEDAQSGADGE